MRTEPKPAPGAPTSPVLSELAAVVVKDGVAIGGLSDAQRRLALAFVWAGLPAGPMTEREVNEALRAQLDGPARCLHTDHVELRRWLVDAGWMVRDGFGREYRRVPAAALPAAARDVGAALDGMDTPAWAAGRRASHEALRAERRRAFESRAASGAAPPAHRAA